MIFEAWNSPGGNNGSSGESIIKSLRIYFARLNNNGSPASHNIAVSAAVGAVNFGNEQTDVIFGHLYTLGTNHRCVRRLRSRENTILYVVSGCKKEITTCVEFSSRCHLV